MKVWIDIMSGDEMTSDSYPFSESFEGACLEVKSKLLTKNANEDFGIGGKTNYIKIAFIMLKARWRALSRQFFDCLRAIN